MKLHVIQRNLLFILVGLFSLALPVCSSQAATYTETFSGPLNPKIWEVFTSGHGETVEVQDGHLVIKIPAVPGDQTYFAGIRSTFDHGYPCEAQVDYNLVTWPAWDNKASAGIYGESMYVIRTQINDYFYGSHWFECACASFHGNVYQAHLAPEGVQGGMQGSLRLSYHPTLAGDGYYNIGEGWQPIGGYSPHSDGGPFILQVTEWGSRNTPGKDVEVHFDNFSITGPNVPKRTAALPADYLLLLDD
jgi:hypothetical protein